MTEQPELTPDPTPMKMGVFVDGKQIVGNGQPPAPRKRITTLSHADVYQTTPLHPDDKPVSFRLGNPTDVDIDGYPQKKMIPLYYTEVGKALAAFKKGAK